MMQYKRKFSQLFGAALVLPLLGIPLGSNAQSACKGLSKSACGANSACVYVSGYARKDGAKVSAHCRVKGKGQAKKTTGKATKDAKRETKKATEKKAAKKTSKKKKRLQSQVTSQKIRAPRNPVKRKPAVEAQRNS